MTALQDHHLVVNYDKHADVLYIALGVPVPAETDMDEHGFFLRFSIEDGEPCGVTVPGFRKDHWDHELTVLEGAVAGHLGISPPAVAKALHVAMGF